MKVSTLALRVVLIAVIAACTPPAEAPPPTPEQVVSEMPQTREEATARDTCDAARFLHLVGTRMDAIDPATLPEGARLLTPDALVTQDFRPDRLNVMSGTDGLVSSLACY